MRAFHWMRGGLVAPATMWLIADYSGRVGKGRAMAFYGMSLAAANLVVARLGLVLSSAIMVLALVLALRSLKRS